MGVTEGEEEGGRPSGGLTVSAGTGSKGPALVGIGSMRIFLMQEQGGRCVPAAFEEQQGAWCSWTPPVRGHGR